MLICAPITVQFARYPLWIALLVALFAPCTNLAADVHLTFKILLQPRLGQINKGTSTPIPKSAFSPPA